MAAAAPPPMPLYSAIICGMSVIATRLPLTKAMMPPAAMAPITSIRLRRGRAHESQRHDGGEQHADARPAHAAHGGHGRTHALQAQDEQGRGDQIGQLRPVCNVEAEGMLLSFLLAGRHEHLQHAFGDDVAAHGVAGRQKYADGADDPCTACCRPRPSATIAPTNTMPCTKFDPDMSGVCRMTGTREMTS